MTAIAAAAAVTPSVSPVASAASPAVAAPATTAPESTSAAPQPAVIVSISANAASAAATASSAPTGQPLTVNATPDQVSKALGAVGDTDFDIFNYNHIDWNGIYQDYGEQAVMNTQASLLGELKSDHARAVGMGSEFQIPIQSNITLPTESNGTVSGSPTISGGITVAPFTFSSQGSTYAVTTNAAGQIVGTKNGQAWQTWGIPANDIPSTTDELAALLASFNAKDAAANSAAQTASAAATASSAPTVQPVTVNATSDQVSRTLGAAGDANVLVFDYNHIDWNGIYEQGGAQAVQNTQASFISELNSTNARAVGMGAEFGIPIQSNLTLPTESNGTVLGSPTISGGITVAPFTFSSQGSTYAVTTNTAGQIVGTKDGQAWQTWGMPANTIPSTADELVALLTSFKAKDAASNSAAQTANSVPAKVDVFA